MVLFTNKEIVANLSANYGKIYAESFLLPDHNRDREVFHVYNP